ncbi:MAG: tRNA (adenosine(37)-N6)-threonylcarbamoyltransferase complex dimerization subunit type 1 TsaB [Oenococcus sp.]|uniref:tRNA (adenosine(37)-N6)-threonylcarbamoyltransferase complex dimerization subunit type 1 TsaB n=1 Tax=Oenococcus sp. TaxID=1979414 RepID=UPI0039EC9888
MKILSIDTSGSSLNVGLLDSSTGLFFAHEHTKDEARTHSMKILPAIQALMTKAGWSFDQLDRIALTAGPGSFTGLRIGAAVAKMIAGQTSAELVPVSTLEMIALSARLSAADPNTTSYLPMINARNHNVFAAICRPGKPLDDEGHWPFADFLSKAPKNSIFVFEQGTGDDFKAEIQTAGLKFIEQPSEKLIDAKLLAQQGLSVARADADSFAPRYLRKTAAEMAWLKKHPDANDGDYAKYVSEV